MKISYRRKKIEIPVKNVPFFSAGLILRTRNTQNLFFKKIFPKNSSLTSYFVFFPFLILWLNKKNKVVDIRIAKPFERKISTRKKFSHIIELPFNNKNKKIIRLFVGKKKIKFSSFPPAVGKKI